MAVWLQVYGNCQVPETDKEKLSLCQKVFSGFDLDLSFLEGNFAGEKFEYNKNLWKVTSEQNFLGRDFFEYQYPLTQIFFLKVYLFADVLAFSGPYQHFQYPTAFTENTKIMLGYQKCIRQIFMAFGVSEAIYFGENFLLNDEFDLGFSDLQEQMQRYPQNQVSRLEDMKDDTFFVDRF